MTVTIPKGSLRDGHRIIVIQMSGLADPVPVQLRNQELRMAGHTTRSLERTRLAIIQLRATNVLTDAQYRQVERRFGLLVLQRIHAMKGKGAASHVRVTQVG